MPLATKIQWVGDSFSNDAYLENHHSWSMTGLNTILVPDDYPGDTAEDVESATEGASYWTDPDVVVFLAVGRNIATTAAATLASVQRIIARKTDGRIVVYGVPHLDGDTTWDAMNATLAAQMGDRYVAPLSVTTWNGGDNVHYSAGAEIIVTLAGEAICWAKGWMQRYTGGLDQSTLLYLPTHSLSLSGSAWIDCGTPANLNFNPAATAKTLIGWVRNAADANGYLFAKGPATTTATFTHGAVGSNAFLGGGGTAVASAVSLVSDTWRLWGFTFDGAGNGRCWSPATNDFATGPTAIGTVNATAQPFRLGARADGSNPLAAKIYMPMMFDESFTSGQFRAIAAMGPRAIWDLQRLPAEVMFLDDASGSNFPSARGTWTGTGSGVSASNLDDSDYPVAA